MVLREVSIGKIGEKNNFEPIFTMKGCTDKDAIFDFFVANDLNCKGQFFHKQNTNYT